MADSHSHVLARLCNDDDAVRPRKIVTGFPPPGPAPKTRPVILGIIRLVVEGDMSVGYII
jgi:hypothetical protein